MLEEMLVNANIAGRPAIWGNPSKPEFVVVWVDASGVELKGARISSSGIKIGNDFSVATADNLAGSPVIAPIHDVFAPGFVVAWIVGRNVFFQRFTRDGVRAGGVVQANTTPVADGEKWPVIAALPEGFVISWASGLQGIRAQVFRNDGTKFRAEIVVNTSDGEHLSPAMTALGGGGFVIAWDRPGSGITPASNRLQIFDSDGNKLGAELISRRGMGLGPRTLSFIVPTGGGDVPEFGDFVNVRLSSAGTGSEGADPGAIRIVVAQLFAPDGVLKNELNVTHVDDQTLCSSPAVTALPMLAGLVVTWTEKQSPTTGSFNHTIKATRLQAQAEGAKDFLVSGESTTKVNTQPNSGQDFCCATAFGENGEFIAVAWVDDRLEPPFRPAVKARILSSSQV